MSGKFAAVISRSASRELRTRNAMLDWPEQSQTSPTSTLRTVTVLAPEAVSSDDTGEAGSGLSVTRHLPSARVITVAFWLRNATSTFSAAAASPQTTMG